MDRLARAQEARDVGLGRLEGFSPRRRAARLCQDMAGILLLDASLLRDARAPSVRRAASRWPIFIAQWLFFRFVRDEAARALGSRRRVSWRLDYHFNGLSRTNLVQNTGFCLGLCQTLGTKPVSHSYAAF